MSTAGHPGLVALVVDDELPALSELGYLLGRDDRVEEVLTAGSGTDALQLLDTRDVDVVFSDISMPGLDGMALARVISRFAVRPQVVFVTAHERHAVDAFALDVTDYVMKPVRDDRLREAVRRVVDQRERATGATPGRPDDSAVPPSAVPSSPAPPSGTPQDGVPPAASAPEDETIPVELGGVTRFITRSRIRYAQAHGDYARLHTDSGSHLVRIPLSVLADTWAEHGFVRIHRSTLVALQHVREVRMDHGRCSVVVGSVELQVSRRHTKALRETLLRSPLGERRT